jgi:L-fucono-1,5-lactonase
VRSCFGDDGVLFGSDWPVCLLAASYDQVVDALLDALGPIDNAAAEKLFGANARRIYRLLPV